MLYSEHLSMLLKVLKLFKWYNILLLQKPSCISSLFLCNKLPQNSMAWNNKRLLPHSFCGAGTWSGFGSGLLKEATRMLGGLRSSQGSNGGRTTSKLTWLLAEFSSLLAAGWRHQFFLPPLADRGRDRHLQVSVYHLSEEKMRKGTQENSESFYNLIVSDVLCLLEVNQLSPTHTLGEGITQKCECWEVGITGGHSGVCLPHSFSPIFSTANMLFWISYSLHYILFSYDTFTD